eukprot:TRINITY_DN5745_c0_g1_i1.p1 TRINITY_DN5745_c0_g1~~TRINITY_DN5745_c0_g1_i1.p1  ORF type:complete len:188 (-),score=5.64 TRINITY_DN5745_c0_g1_i1:9-572(-)
MQQGPSLDPALGTPLRAAAPLQFLHIPLRRTHDISVTITVTATAPQVFSGHESEDLFEHRLVARDREWARVAEPELLLGLREKLLEERVVQIRGADHESPRIGAHADRYVARGHVGRNPSRWGPSRGVDLGCYGGLGPPAAEHLAEPDNVLDLAAFSDAGRHCRGCREISRCEEYELVFCLSREGES